MLQRIIQWTVGIVLAAAGSWVFLRSVDLHSLAFQLSHTNPMTLIFIGLLAVAAIWIRALRSMFLLPSCTASQRKQLFPIAMIAFMFNNILPARIGEAVRAVLLWKRVGYSGAVSVGSIILERVLDTLVLLSCFFIPILFAPALVPNAAGQPLAKTIAVGFLAIFSGGVIALLAYSRFPLWAKRFGRRCIGAFPKKISQKMNRIAADLVSNLEWTFSFRRSALVIVLSYMISASYALMTMLMVREASFGILSGMFVQSFAAFGTAIPLAPGYVGTMHAVMFQGFLLCGIEKEKAGAATILFHAIPYITVTIIGLLFFFKARFSLSDIRNARVSLDETDKEDRT
jgi:hypothetical protein